MTVRVSSRFAPRLVPQPCVLAVAKEVDDGSPGFDNGLDNVGREDDLATPRDTVGKLDRAQYFLEEKSTRGPIAPAQFYHRLGISNT